MGRCVHCGQASYPFRFDVHAIFFSEDAVGIEQGMREGLGSVALI